MSDTFFQDFQYVAIYFFSPMLFWLHVFQVVIALLIASFNITKIVISKISFR